MGRLLDSSDVNNVIMLEKEKYGVLSTTIGNIVEDIISKVPTARVEEKTVGQWLVMDYCCSDDGYSMYTMHQCSQCGFGHCGYKGALTPYCPMCGSHNGGGED